MKKIEILYEDESCLVINKPAGLAVQGGVGVKTSLDKILAENYNPAPLLVHRLDKDTSGVILTAKTKTSAAQFSRLLAPHSTSRKIYIAVCAGRFAAEKGCFKFDLQIDGSSKKAETRYTVIGNGKIEADDFVCEYSVLELELGTGRMHQIRRHLAMNGTPVLGDDKYGDFSLNKKLRKVIRLKRLLLHARRLVISEYNLDVTAPLPPEFEEFCHVLLR